VSATSQTVASTRARERQPSGWSHLRKLIPYVLRYKGMAGLGLLTLVLMGLLGALPQLIIGIVVDCLEKSPHALATLSGTARWLLSPLFGLYAPGSRHALGIYCLLIVGIMLAKGFFSFWTRWILIGMSRDIEYDLRNDLLGRLLRMEPEYYVRNRTGDLMSRATNDLNAVRMVLGPGIMYSATTAATMALAIFFMVKLSPMLTLYVLLPVPIVAVAVWYFGQIIHRLSERIQAALGVLSTRAQENLTGMRVVRAFTQEKQEITRFDEANREYVDRNIKLIGSWSLFFPALTAIIGLAFVILLGMGGEKAIMGRLSIGTFTAFFVFLTQLIWPMIALGWVTNIFQRGAASMGRLRYILEAEPGISDAARVGGTDGNGRPHAREAESNRGADAQQIQGEIEFRGLTFRYPTASGPDPVLRNINLHIPAGSTLAIIGPTGSGKSTMAALIARMWEAPPGTLRIDGRSIRDYRLEDLRRAIGYVPQDTFLFSETIRENIGLGVQEWSDEMVRRAAEIGGIAAEIEGFPQGFHTMVGERGVTLSGGQKQRTSLARAIAREPRILILDDALSSVDTETEARVLRHLRRVMRERTTILVAHRISTVQDADQIVVLRAGEIIERGTHEELVALGGYYADLYRKQLLEEELERE